MLSGKMKVVSEVYTSWVDSDVQERLGEEEVLECEGDAVDLAYPGSEHSTDGVVLRMNTSLSPEEFRRIFVIGAVIEEVNAWALAAGDDRYKLFYFFRKVNEKFETVQVHAENKEAATKLIDTESTDPWSEIDHSQDFSERVHHATQQGTEIVLQPESTEIKILQKIFDDICEDEVSVTSTGEDADRRFIISYRPRRFKDAVYFANAMLHNLEM